MNYRSIAIQSNQSTFYIYPVSKHGWLAGNPRIRHLNGNINISYATWGTVHCHRLDSQRVATCSNQENHSDLVLNIGIEATKMTKEEPVPMEWCSIPLSHGSLPPFRQKAVV